MADLVNLGAILKLAGVSSFVGGMGKVSKSSSRASVALDSVVRGIGRFTRNAATAAVALGGVGLKKFADFELQIARIGTVMPRGSDAMARFGDEVLNNSVKFGQAATNVADATFQALSSGVDSAKSAVTPFTETAGKLSVAGFTDMKTAVDGLTNSMNAFGIPTAAAEDVANKFLITNKLGKTTIGELSTALGRVAPTAKALGVSLEEVLAATASITAAGTGTNETMSALKAVFSNMKEPTDKAKEAVEGLDIAFGLKTLRERGLVGALKELVDKTRGQTAAQSALFGSVEAFNAIARLTATDGAALFTKALEEQANAAGELESRFTSVADTTGFKLKQLKAGLGRVFIELGAGLAEGFGIRSIENIPKFVAKAAKAVRAGAAAFAAGFSEAFAPLFRATDFDFETFMGDLGRGIGTVASTIVSAISTIARHFDKVVAVVKVLVGIWLAQKFIGALTTISGMVSNIGTKLSSISRLGGLGGALSKFARGIPVVAAGVGILSALSGVRGTNVEKKDLARQIYGTPSAGALAAGAVAPSSLSDVAQQALFGRVRSKPGALLQALAAPGADLIAQDIAVGVARQTSAQLALETEAQAITQGVIDKGQVSINWLTEQVLNFDGKKQWSPGGASGSFRGRGDADVATTTVQQYIIHNDRLVLISDDFNFSQLGGEANQ